MLVHKRNGKWSICIYYRELNKYTQKNHFLLPFVYQVLDTLIGNKYFSFLVGFSGYKQIQIAPEDQDKKTFTCPWRIFSYIILTFGLWNAPTTFQRENLSIFYNLINDELELYMDDFTHGNEFYQALDNMENVLEQCIATRLCLNNEKFHMLMT